MNLIIFPGNSLRNKEWADGAEQAFKNVEGIDTIYKHYYKHWETGEAKINFETEIERIKENLPFGKPHIVFAKSAGSLLTLYATAKGVLDPTKAVFAGMPIAKPGDSDLPFEIETWQVPTIVIQNDHDPVSTAETVRQAIVSKPNMTLIEREGDNHDYLDFENIKKQVAGFLTE